MCVTPASYYRRYIRLFLRNGQASVAYSALTVAERLLHGSTTLRGTSALVSLDGWWRHCHCYSLPIGSERFGYFSLSTHIALVFYDFASCRLDLNALVILVLVLAMCRDQVCAYNVCILLMFYFKLIKFTLCRKNRRDTVTWHHCVLSSESEIDPKTKLLLSCLFSTVTETANNSSYDQKVHLLQGRTYPTYHRNK